MTQTDVVSMSTGMIPALSMDVLFCDEIRQESNGKIAYIGAYGRDFVVPSFPAEIMQLVAQITVRYPVTESVVISKIIFNLPGQAPREKLPPPPVLIGSPMGGASKNSGKRTSMRYTERLTNLHFSEGGSLSVSIEIDGVLYSAGGVRVIDELHLLDEVADSALSQPAIDATLGYMMSFMEQVAPNKADGATDLVEILKSICHEKFGLDVADPEQPVWAPLNRHTIWVLKTRPWHTASSLTASFDDRLVPFKVERENSIGLLLAFEESAILMSRGLSITATQPKAD